jgi:hypothetical protein
VYEVVAQRDADDLRSRLAIEGCAVRALDGAGVTDGAGLLARAAEAFGSEPLSGWDAFSDRLWTAVVPEDADGAKAALVWEHADSLLSGDLPSFLMAFDVAVTTARQAYRQGVDLTIFLLGDGPGFPPLH